MHGQQAVAPAAQSSTDSAGGRGRGGRSGLEQLDDDSLDIGAREAALQGVPLEDDVEENLRLFRLITGPSSDIAMRRMIVECEEGPTPAAVLHIQGIVDRERIEHVILAVSELPGGPRADAMDKLQYKLVRSSRASLVETFADAWDELSGGSALVLVQGHRRALACSNQAYNTRQIEEAPTDTTIRGPRQGFVEDLSVNLSLLRQWIRTPNLWIETTTVGRLSRTPVSMAYIKGLASEELLAEVRQRVQRVDVDALGGAGPLMEMIQDTHLTFVPLALTTERPDMVVGNLMDGRVALLVQNSPFALVVPMDYGMLFHAADDHYEFVPIAAVMSVLRVVAFWTSILLPGIFVSVLTFHDELLPTPLPLRIVSDRAGVPLPVVLEVLTMELVFELLREAGLRLPRAVGSAVTIVGALILGEAAINAGLVSPSVIVVVAATAISSFVLPTFSFSIPIRLLRFVFIALAGILGLLGVYLGAVGLIAILSSHRSFGHPFMVPMAPVIPGDFSEYIFRAWQWQRVLRPKLTGGREQKRQPKRQMPRQERSPEREGRSEWRDGKAGE